MFAAACASARRFTRPVISSYRKLDRTCESIRATYVVLNNEGWIMTAAHVLDQQQRLSRALESGIALEPEGRAIRENSKLTDKAKKRRWRKLYDGKDVVANYSLWWGVDRVVLKDAVGLGPDVDLAVGRLEPFDPAWVEGYPTLKDPASGVDPGTSLCRTGFPLHVIEPQFDESTGNFLLPDGSQRPSYFPMAGMYTRTVGIDDVGSGTFPLMFLETSIPSLPGHSGGPIFDAQGTVWSITGTSQHFEVELTLTKRDDGARPFHHPLLSLGYGAHPETICGFLDERGIEYKTSDY